MNEPGKKDWLKLKRYPHIGLPLSKKDLPWVIDYVTDNKKIAGHSFLPFIHKTKKERRFRKTYSEDTGLLNYTLYFDDIHVRTLESKPRELYYSSHLDSVIYSYYSSLLAEKYEKIIELNDLENNVTAYRSIPIETKFPEGPKKCNINFAHDIFKRISSRKEDSFLVVALDIKGFFDNLCHDKIKKDLSKIVTGNPNSKLPPDYFNIYKSLTRFRYVDLVEMFEHFKTKLIASDQSHLSKKKFKNISVSKIKFMREHDCVAFCEKKEFLKAQNKLLKTSKFKIDKNGEKVINKSGIPQGTPASCILANLYMLEFDKKVKDFIESNNGIYQRYSDDIIVVIPNSIKSQTLELIQSSISDSRLEIKKSKTQIFHFKRKNEKLICGQEFEETINWDKNLKYLGFEFDGQDIRIKSASLSNFYRKMKRAIYRGTHYAKFQGTKFEGELFKQRLWKQFSYKGAKRKRKWYYNKKTSRFESSNEYNYGNFLTYCTKASKVMKSNAIKRQTKKAWRILNDLIKKAEVKVQQSL